uniref:Uncharacterized protein n=1 Tax=Anguilla anguilla TaxID=7936 RepID=A0A0E9PT57_ANGAN
MCISIIICEEIHFCKTLTVLISTEQILKNQMLSKH